MNLRSLFNRLVPTKKIGTPAPEAFHRKSSNKYLVQFTNLEDAPTYEVKTVLVVGSEVGDVVISDPSLAPKHATFTFKNGLVSVVDHATTSGTKLKGTSLPAGRAVILEADDELELGTIAIRIVGEFDASAEDRPAPEPTKKLTIIKPKPQPELELESADEPEDDEDEEVEERPSKKVKVVRPPKPGFFSRLKTKIQKKFSIKKKSKGKVAGGGIDRVANTIPRVFALLLELVWVLTLWQILAPFEEFQFVLELLPSFFKETIRPEIEVLMNDFGLMAQYQEYTGMVGKFLEVPEKELHLSLLLSLWINLRLMWTLVFGISLGYFMAGIRSQDNPVWKRAGGFIREVVGLVTFPLVIFDLPALFSRRTLKEVLTLTTVSTPSKGSVLVSLVLFVPLSLVALTLSPFVTGLDFPEPIQYSELQAHKKRAKNKPVEVVRVEMGSTWFGANFKVNTAQWWVLPRFTWSQNDGKASLTPSLIFHGQGGASVPIVLSRRFEWSYLVGPIFSHNIIAHRTYPVTWKMIESTKINADSALSYRPTDADKNKFSLEVQDIIRSMFKLTPETLMDHVQTYGPFIKGYLQAREQFLALTEADGQGAWNSITIGKTPVLIYEKAGARPEEDYIPLVAGPGRLFRVSYSSAKEKKNLGKQVREDILEHVDWQFGEVPAKYTLVRWIDTVAGLGTQSLAPEKVQDELKLAYESFGEAVAPVSGLPPTDPKKLALAKCLKNSTEVLEQIAASYSRPEDAGMQKSIKGFAKLLNDMRMQLESGNSAFFGQPAAPKKVQKKRVIRRDDDDDDDDD